MQVKIDTYSSAISRCVLGTAGLGGVWGKVDSKESVDTILEALEKGITAIDTAPAYGDAEQYIGEALRQWKGVRPVVSTKVGRLKSFATDEGYYDYSPESMERSVQQSLETMQLEQVDILFLHEPVVVQPRQAEQVLETLQLLKQKGYTRRLGVGGNAPDWFRPFISSGAFDVMMEYNRLNACCVDALHDSLPYCSTNKMHYYAASPLYMGLLGSKFEEFTKSPPAWLPAEPVQQALKLEKTARVSGIPLSSMAHRFLLTYMNEEVSMVIGAMNSQQFNATLNDIEEGPLEPGIREEILNTLQEETHA